MSTVTTLPKQTFAALRPRDSVPTRLRRVVRRQPIGAISAIYLILVVLAAIFADFVAPNSPVLLLGRRLEAPGSVFLLGTDSVGRDVLARVIYGARVSLLVGFFAVGMATFGGAIIGIVSGYIGGRVDIVIQRGIDALMGLPPLLLALVLATVLGPSMRNSVIAIAIAILPYQVRVIRSGVLTLRQEQYVEAARAIGASTPRIMLRTILPNVMPIVITLATLQLSGAIIAEASLSFLGLGVQPPTASWGEMLSGPGRTYMESAPWIVLGPGIALMLVVLAFNMLGDAMRDVLDPRLRGGG